MGYAIKECFFTLQGEGARTGRAAVFCRFTGCNLWSGREADRATAVCQFCDTDFVGTDGDGGGRFATAEALADHVASRWPLPSEPTTQHGRRYVVCTGGEPLLQLDGPLIEALHARGFEIAIETNGTIEVPMGVDWICVSPKAGSELIVSRGHELKLVYPQVGAEPERFTALAFDHFFLQPLDDLARKKHERDVIAYCMAHPHWRLSLQTHKLLGIR